MPLAQLYNPVGSDDWFAKFVDYNFSDHQLVLNALQAQKNVVIPMLAINSSDQATMGTWALGHQALHDATNSYFGFSGSDYTHLPLDDLSALQTLGHLHAEEHRRWHEALEI